MAKSFALFSRKFIFCELLRIKRAKPEIFFAKFAHKRNFSFAQFAQNRKFYAKCNFLGTLSKIDILSLELNKWRFIPHIKNINIQVW